jgi:hypothetical protein
MSAHGIEVIDLLNTKNNAELNKRMIMVYGLKILSTVEVTGRWSSIVFHFINCSGFQLSNG